MDGVMLMAETTDVGAIFGTAIGSIQSDAMGMIGQALPVALGIVGVVLAITIGMKVFKRFAKG